MLSLETFQRTDIHLGTFTTVQIGEFEIALIGTFPTNERTVGGDS
jgi:hypothetical protein